MVEPPGLPACDQSNQTTGKRESHDIRCLGRDVKDRLSPFGTVSLSVGTITRLLSPAMSRLSDETAPLLDGRQRHHHDRQNPELSPKPPKPLDPACDPLGRRPSPCGSSSAPASSSSSSTSDRVTSRSTVPDVACIDAVSSQLTTLECAWLFAAIFLVGCAYSLESQVLSTYQPYATSSFSLHSYLSTINLLRSVVAVAFQPAAAKVANVFGRFEVILLSTVCYVLDMAIESTASSVYVFCVGAVVYQISYTCLVLLFEVLVADFSSMRARVFLSYVPALPFIVNTWISGTVTAAVLKVSTWRWGIGMW